MVNIPGYILNSGKYMLCANLVTPNFWYEHNKKGVVFELFDFGSSHRLKGGRSSGVIAMPLDWEIEEKSEKEK